MNKTELLDQIKSLAKDDLVAKSEILDAYQGGLALSKKDRHLHISKILYFVGGAIVFIGIVILVGQNWQSLNSLTQILVTFGSAIAAYIVGVLFIRYEKLDYVGQAFFFLSAVLAPLGLLVTFNLSGFNIGSASVQSIISLIVFGAYLASFIIYRKPIFIIFSLIFGTWLFFAITQFLFASSFVFSDFAFIRYRILLVGLSFISLGYYFTKSSEKAKRSLTGWLYSFGILGFLGAALDLGGWRPNQNMFWELIYPGLVLGTLFLSIYLKSRAFLIFGSLALIAYIYKITVEYFSGSIGWPLALVLSGFFLMAVGYLAYYLNRKYLS